jgi:hypothetical protein
MGAACGRSAPLDRTLQYKILAASNRVISDPFARRAGMWFPEFWAKFFDGLARMLSH